MKHSFCKRFMSLLLVAALLCSFGVTALADPIEPEFKPSVSIGGAPSGAVEAGTKVTLTASVETNAPEGYTVEKTTLVWTGATPATEGAASVEVTVNDKMTVSVEATVVYKKSDVVTTDVSVTKKATDTVTLTPGYHVYNEVSEDTYQLVLKVDGKAIANGALVAKGKTVDASVEAKPGYVLVNPGKVISNGTTVGSEDLYFGVGGVETRAKTGTVVIDTESALPIGADKASQVITGDTSSHAVTYGGSIDWDYPTGTVEVTKDSKKKIYEITGWKYIAGGKDCASIDAALAGADGDKVAITAVAQWGEKQDVTYTITVPTSTDTSKYTIAVSSDPKRTGNDKYQKGDRITLTVTAKPGYKLNAQNMMASDNGAVTPATVTANKTMSFTYVVGESNATLSFVNPEVVTAIKLTFNFDTNATKDGTLSNSTLALKAAATSRDTTSTWSSLPQTYGSLSAVALPYSGTLSGRLVSGSSYVNKTFDLQDWTLSSPENSMKGTYKYGTLTAAALQQIVSTLDLHTDTTLTFKANWDSSLKLEASMALNIGTLGMVDYLDSYEGQRSSLYYQLLDGLGLSGSNSTILGGYSVKFTSLGNATAGALYVGDARTNSAKVNMTSSYYLGYGYASKLLFSELQFVPNTQYEKQTYIAKFDVYNGITKVTSGTMTIETGIKGDIVWYLDGDDTVQFNAEDFDEWYYKNSNKRSLDNVEFSLVDWSFSKYDGYICYGGTDSKSELNEREFERETYYYKSSSSKYSDLGELYYVAGSKPADYYVINFTCNDSTGRRNSLDGVLVIMTKEGDNNTTTGADLVYNVKYDDTLELDPDDFYAFAGKNLSYVVFDVGQYTKGTLLVGTGKNQVVLGGRDRNDLDADTEFYYKGGSRNSYSISDISYEPYQANKRYSQYTEEIGFTAYDSNSRSLKEGTMTICVVYDSVPQVSVTVDPNKSADFKVNDFKTVASKAIGSSAGVDSIVLASLPSTGTIYSGTGTTKATTGTTYSMGTSGKNLVSSLRYDATSKTGKYTATYLAYKGSKLLYMGEILFTVGDSAQDAGSIYAVGALLPVNAISKAVKDALDDTFSYITIEQPTNATVYYNYSKINNHSGAASSNSKYYYSATGSDLSMSKLTVVPYADRTNGEKIDVKISCYDKKGNVTTLTVRYTYVQTTSTTFTDTVDAWYKDSIYFLNSNGIVNGVSTSQYGVGTNIKRGDFALMLYRAFNLGSLTSSTANFSDVNTNNDYYGKAVAAAKALGITNGDGNGHFYPESNITREEAFTLIYRTLTNASVKAKLSRSLPTATTSTLSSFSDYRSIQSYAQTAIATLVKAEIIKGSNGKINPASPISREEMAVILYRALTKY